MSEFKYACPHCGQHIRCDAAQSGTTMECPTCYQKIIAPQAPTGHDPKFILTGSKLPKQRPIGTTAGGASAAPQAAKKFPLVPVVVILLVAAAATAAFLFRDKLFKSAKAPVETVEPEKTIARPEAPPKPAPAAAVNNAKWTLDLGAADFPAAPAGGRLNGKDFTMQRALLLGGLLTLRQGGQGGAPDLGVTIGLHAVKSADLAGKTIVVTTNSPTSPRVTLRWKDAAQKPTARVFDGGYVLRLEFGALAGTRLPGKIYLCFPDDAQSYVAGNFTADIVKPKPTTKPAGTKK